MNRSAMNRNLSNGLARRRRGSTMVEMTLVGIPAIFILISIFEISRGIWLYETLAHAAKAGVRFATVHGADCVPDSYNNINNNCAGTYGLVASVIKQTGIGLDVNATNITFTSEAGTSQAVSVTNTLESWLSNNSSWPPNDGISNTVGQPIAIEVVTPFRSALALFFPGARAVSFAVGNLAGSSQDNIRY